LSLRLCSEGCVFGILPFAALLVAAPHQWGFARIRHSLRSASWRLMRSECRLCRSGRPVQHILSSLCSAPVSPRKRGGGRRIGGFALCLWPAGRVRRAGRVGHFQALNWRRVRCNVLRRTRSTLLLATSAKHHLCFSVAFGYWSAIIRSVSRKAILGT
jgi:hypothetical protein